MRLLPAVPVATLAALLTALPAASWAEPALKPELRVYAFFATWCVPCRIELPQLERIHRDYRDRGVEVVLVSEDAPSTAGNVSAFLARYNVTARWILDNESELLERYNPAAGLPFTVMVDNSGRVLYAHAGYEPGDERLLRAAIDAHLGARDDAPAPAGSTDTSVARRAAPAAPGFQISATSQSLGVYRSSRFDPVPENDGTLLAAVQRIEVRGADRRFRVSARVDGAILDDEVAVDPDRDGRLERISLEATLGPAKLTLGDTYVQFGNGASLSLRKVDPLGVDTTIRGARVDVDAGQVELLAIAGAANPQNLDPVGLQLVDHESGGLGPGDLLCTESRTCDTVIGAQVGWRPSQRLRVSPYAVRIEAPEAAADGSDVVWNIAGSAARFRRGSLQIDAELAYSTRSGMAVADERPFAAYLSLQDRRGNWSWVVEGKAYRDWSIGREDRSLLYHEPPTLEREDQQIPANDNSLGGHGRIELRLPAWSSTAFASSLVYAYTKDGADPWSADRSLATHSYAGLERRFGAAGSAQVSAGYREERDSAGDRTHSLIQVDVDAAFGLPYAILGRRLALTAKWNHRDESKRVFDELAFRRGLAVVGASLAGVGTISGLYGYSNERSDDVAPTHYPGVEILFHLPKGGNIRLFGGRLTGGRVCVSGSCRDVPPFEGARLDALIHF